MPVLFMALIALAVFGGVGILLAVACYSEHRVHRAKVTATGAPLPAEVPLKTRAASSGG